MIHPVKGFSTVDETEVDVFLKFPCFLYNPVNVGNLISSSSSFSKPSLDIWKFLVRMMLKPACKILSMTVVAWEMSAIVRWLAHSLVQSFLGTGMRTDLFQSLATAGSSRIADITNAKSLWHQPLRIRSSAGISLHPLALLRSHGGGGGLVTKSCPTLATPWTVANQAPLPMGFSRQEYWSGLPFPFPSKIPYYHLNPTISSSLQDPSLPHTSYTWTLQLNQANLSVTHPQDTTLLF